MTLDMTKEWHLRFLLNDATSSGYPAGDNAFRLYDFSAVPDPATLSLLLLGGVVAFKRRR